MEDKSKFLIEQEIIGTYTRENNKLKLSSIQHRPPASDCKENEKSSFVKGMPMSTVICELMPTTGNDLYKLVTAEK
jgi:hypothetical protein